MSWLPWLATFLALASVLLGLVWSGRAAQAERRRVVAKAARTTAPRARTAKVAPELLAALPRVAEEAHDDIEITQITAFPSAELARVRALARGDDPGPAITTAAAGPLADDDAPQPSRVELSYEAEAEADEVTSPNIRILVTAIGDSDQGRMRARNEDSLIAFPERSLFAVADGMGGHAAGDVASAVAVDVLRDAFERNAFNAHTESSAEVPRRGRELACAIQMANEAIYALAGSDPNLKGMGTTLVAARFSPNKQRVYIGHVGDSRCYRLRGSTFRQLTTDHTMSSLGVQGPRSHDLFQAVGVGLTIAIDLIVDRPQGEDLYLLCSDGLSKMVSDDVIHQVLLSERDIEAAVYRLMELANDSGGKDNITLILVKVVDRPALELRAAAKTSA